jgi:hypothetical protein
VEAGGVSKFWNPHLVQRRGEHWTLWAAPGRLIEIGHGRHNWWPQDVRLKYPDDARALAVALLEAADIAEQEDPAEEGAA